jgi:hypothetical protein
MIEIALEPADRAYDDLLGLALNECATFSLITRPGLALEPSAHAVLEALEPFLIERLSVTTWPGTDLLGSNATLHRFQANSAAFEPLRGPGRLYAWLAPQYPEDLAFYTSEGGVWLGSCAHEAFAFLDAVPHSLEEIVHLLPHLYVRRRSGRSAV